MKKSIALFALASLTAGAAACGGTDQSTAELRLMDAPPPGVTAVNVSVAAIQVHVAKKGEDTSDGGADGGTSSETGWQTLTVGRTIDLVQHQGYSAATVLGQLPLPTGKITKLRLLIDTARPNTATVNGTTCDLDTSRVDRKGIEVNHVFKAFESRAGSRHEITLDVPLDESLRQEGNCFRLEPKLKLHKVKTDGRDEAL